MTVTAPYNADKKIKRPVSETIHRGDMKGAAVRFAVPSSQVPAASCVHGRRLRDAAVGQTPVLTQAQGPDQSWERVLNS